MSDQRRPEYGPLRQSIDALQPVADQSTRNTVTGEVTLTETREVIGRVTWTRDGARMRVSVDSTVLWALDQKQGPRVTITAKGKW